VTTAGTGSSARSAQHAADVLRRRWTVVGEHVLHSRETSAASRRDTRRRGDASRIVVLPGAGTTSRSFRPLLAVLAEADVPASVLELPGLGGSGGPTPSSVAAVADLVARWLDISTGGPVTLSGVSFGSQVATEVAVRHPGVVDRLVLLGPTVDRGGRNPLEQAGKLLLDASREPLNLLTTVATDTFLTRRRAVWGYLDSSLDHRLEERIPLVRAPVSLVRGSRDPMVPRRWCERLAELAACGEVVELEGGAHGIHHSHAAAVAGLLRR
jgi:pimeloyl-ACP methyl ester carboxylesterase